LKCSRGQTLFGPLHALLQSIDLVFAGLDKRSNVKLAGDRGSGIIGLHRNMSDILGLLAFPICRGYGDSLALFPCCLGWCRRHGIQPKRPSRPFWPGSVIPSKLDWPRSRGRISRVRGPGRPASRYGCTLLTSAYALSRFAKGVWAGYRVLTGRYVKTERLLYGAQLDLRNVGTQIGTVCKAEDVIRHEAVCFTSIAPITSSAG
jgi:hypothetical protein